MKSIRHRILKSAALIVLTQCSLLLAQGTTRPVSADGFVTQATGSGLQVGTLNVQLDEQTRCSKYDNADAAKRASERIRQIGTPCTALALNVGTYVHVDGTLKVDGSMATANVEVKDPWRVIEFNSSSAAPPKLPWFMVT